MKSCCEAVQLCVTRPVIIGVKALYESYVETENYTRQLLYVITWNSWCSGLLLIVPETWEYYLFYLLLWYSYSVRCHFTGFPPYGLLTPYVAVGNSATHY